MLAETTRGKALRPLIPRRARLAVPEHFFAEVAAVLRRWELATILNPADARASLDRLIHWPLRRVQLRSLLTQAWAFRPNIAIADALYVALAERLNASRLTDDHKLAKPHPPSMCSLPPRDTWRSMRSPSGSPRGSSQDAATASKKSTTSFAAFMSRLPRCDDTSPTQRSSTVLAVSTGHHPNRVIRRHFFDL
jgi:predicted nucleic acid-binding protein